MRRSCSACITDPGHVSCFAGKRLVSVFFSLDSTADLRSELQYFCRDFPELTAWHSIYLIGYFIAIKLGNDFSIVILQMSCLKCCNSCDYLGNLGDSQKTGGVLPDSKTIQNTPQWRYAALIAAGKTIDQNNCQESSYSLRSVKFFRFNTAARSSCLF